MPDTFDALRERMQSLRANRDRSEWSTISVQLAGIPRESRHNVADARIDQSLAGNLVGGEPRSFQVEPGEHTVHVRLRRRLRLAGYPGKGIVSLHLTVRLGEQVRLVCGVRPGARDVWSKIQAIKLHCSLVVATGAFLAMGIGSRLTPLVRRLVIEATLYWKIRGRLLPLLHMLFASRVAIVTWAVLAGILLTNRFVAPYRRRLLFSLEHQFDDPYFLRKAEENTDGREPAH